MSKGEKIENATSSRRRNSTTQRSEARLRAIEPGHNCDCDNSNCHGYKTYLEDELEERRITEMEIYKQQRPSTDTIDLLTLPAKCQCINCPLKNICECVVETVEECQLLENFKRKVEKV